MEEATAAAIVYKAGATDVTVNTGINTVTATGTLKIGAIEMSVTSTDNSNAELSYDYNGITYKGASPEEVIDNIIKANPDNFVGFPKDKEIDRKSIAYK